MTWRKIQVVITSRPLGAQSWKKILKVFWATPGSRTHAEKAFQSAFLIRVLPEGIKFSACSKNLRRTLSRRRLLNLSFCKTLFKRGALIPVLKKIPAE
jgi:hypothetical protein